VGKNAESAYKSRLKNLRPGVAVAVGLLVAYVVTLAPGVTFWDAGEFLAAIKTLGVPHPPGTPLYILAANVWAKVFAPIFGFAYSVNLLSAVSTAVACGVFASLMARWTRDPLAAVAGGLLAGLMSSVWLNANETEVYAPSLLMSALLMYTAFRADETREARWLILLGYLFGLAWSLQLSALVVAPAALLLAFQSWRERKISIVPMIMVAAVGASAVLFMLVRARHDPGVNQGNPATWSTFMDVITRKQYQPVSILPRQAPWYIQIGNLFEYSDWQVALGLHPDPPPSMLRTPITAIYAFLGVIGSIWHRRVHRPSWRVLMLLFICGTLGVVAYLNMKASPSYGHGFVPANAKHEARERDYFFALGFLCWGLWAGAGAVRAFARAGPRLRYAGVLVAMLPFFLNFKATDRAHGGNAHAARDSALKILTSTPAKGVVFAYGDNDTYPVWYAQYVEGVRTDVTTITIPLLGASWYRAELARRHGLLDSDKIRHWRGYDATLATICRIARERGRPIVAKEVRDRPVPPRECMR
jgi:hypothetical protein